MKKTEDNLPSSELIAPPPQPGGARDIEVGESGVALRSLDDLLRFARMAVKSGFAPAGMDTEGAALAIQAGAEVAGLAPFSALQALVPVKGNLTWRTKAAAALIRNSGVCVPGTLRFGVEGDGDTRRGFAVAQRVGYAAPQRVEFSVEDAKRAGLWGKDNWRHYPDRMLQARALGHLATDLFSDVLGGFHLADVAQDFEAPTADRASHEAPKAVLEKGPPSPDPLAVALGITPAATKLETVEELEVVEVCRHNLEITEDCPECAQMAADDAAKAGE